MTEMNAPKILNSIWNSSKNTIIQENSLVILYDTHVSLSYCYVTRNELFQNRHGIFQHNDMIGKPFGSILISTKKDNKGFIILLASTPELWNRVLRHRTQIIFTLDASCIQFRSNMKSGSLVLESGTGSGALTTSFARTVAPLGHVYTFEFNATRAEIARKEFERNDLGECVTIQCCDAYVDGFPETLNGKMDIAFFDLPCPWKVVHHATKVLKQGGRFVSYSPCLEQVQKTCCALREAGYELIQTLETRLIPYSARHIDLPMPDFGHARPEQERCQADVHVDHSQVQNKKQKTQSYGEHIVAKRKDDIRGHTAFLTFAYKFFA